MPAPNKPVLAVDRSSELQALASTVWHEVSTMVGVNAELHPWIHMTVPAVARGVSLTSLADVCEHETLFHSWLLALGALPIDRHSLGIEALWTGLRDGTECWGFRERSKSWTEHTWIHERTILPGPRGCVIRDRVWITPRRLLRWLGLTTVLAAIVSRLFAHRHRYLRRKFDQLAA